MKNYLVLETERDMQIVITTVTALDHHCPMLGAGMTVKTFSHTVVISHHLELT